MIEPGDIVVFKDFATKNKKNRSKMTWGTKLWSFSVSRNKTWSKTHVLWSGLPMMYLGKIVLSPGGLGTKQYKYHQFLHKGKTCYMTARGMFAHVDECFDLIKKGNCRDRT